MHRCPSAFSEMEAKERVLIPGLPEELVLESVVTRLPWYVRPVCRALSKSWRICIDTSLKRPPLQLKSREHQLPLLQGCFLVCTFDARIFITNHPQLGALGYRRIPWQCETYQMHKQWRMLPPLQAFLPPPPTRMTLLASSGMVYAWSNGEPDKFVLKIDLGCGDWTWNKFPVPHPLNDNAVHFNGKIYVPRVSTGGVLGVSSEEAPSQGKEVVLVYDMMTDQCEQLNVWNRNNLRVLCKKTSGSHVKEELYSFVEHEFVSEPSKLEILVYDACGDSWKTGDKIPFPEYVWSELPQVHLVNHNCFEPAPDMGINTVWDDPEGEVVSWCNSSLHEAWVQFDHNAFLEGKCVEYIQFIRGSLFAIFMEYDEGQDEPAGKENKHGQEEEDGEDQQDPMLLKRTLMKGTMSVSSNMVNWEEVLDVGCFLESYYLNPSRVTPITHYTLMA